MRRPLIAGNWKMHGSYQKAEELINGIATGLKHLPAQDIDVLVLPPFVYLSLVKDCIAKSHAKLALGAQNLFLGDQGAFTGEISGTMLHDVGCQYVLVGHSERRALFHEDNKLTAEKCQAAIAAGLVPILCVGETQAERAADKTEHIIHSQIEPVLTLLKPEELTNLIIAYEPVWAIGTGLTATPQQAQSVHAFIRNIFKQNGVAIADTIRILYGGSMKPDNAAALLSMPDIDGGLIGGASLDAQNFLNICDAAQNSLRTAKVTKTG